MKTILLIAALLGSYVGETYAAGSESIIKQRAKDLRDQNNARQGVVPANPPPRTSGTAPVSAPATPAPLSPGQQTVMRLQSEFAAIKAGAPVPSSQRDKLANLLSLAAQGTGKPSNASAQKLASEICDALSEKALPPAGRAKLAQNLEGLLNPARYPQAQKQAIIQDMETLFKSSGGSASRAVAIRQAAKVVGDEVEKGR